MTQWTIGGVLDAIAETVPDRLMTVCGGRRSTFAESADRTRRLANFLAGHGFGVHREREELENWECGQDRVALIECYPADLLVVGSSSMYSHTVHLSVAPSAIGRESPRRGYSAINPKR